MTQRHNNRPEVSIVLLLLFVIVAVASAYGLFALLRLIFCYRRVVAGEAKLLTHCTKCQYALVGLGTSPTCPECNTHHPTIYTFEPRTVWMFRTHMLPNYLGMAAVVLVCWVCISILFPPAATALVYWNKGWECSGRVSQSWAIINGWGGPTLIASMVLTWLAGCVAAIFLRWRPLLALLAIVMLVGLSGTLIDLTKSSAWTGDWFNYFWLNRGDDFGFRIIFADLVAVAVVLIATLIMPNLHVWKRENPAIPAAPQTPHGQSDAATLMPDNPSHPA